MGVWVRACEREFMVGWFVGFVCLIGLLAVWTVSADVSQYSRYLRIPGGGWPAPWEVLHTQAVEGITHRGYGRYYTQRRWEVLHTEAMGGITQI